MIVLLSCDEFRWRRWYHPILRGDGFPARYVDVLGSRNDLGWRAEPGWQA
jgi:hypothetical protein